MNVRLSNGLKQMVKKDIGMESNEEKTQKKTKNELEVEGWCKNSDGTEKSIK